MKMSFYDWCVFNNHLDILNRWDYDLNQQTPDKVGSKTNELYYFKCPNKIHPSQKHAIVTITRSSGACRCDMCYLQEHSFGVWCANNNPDLLSFWDYDLNNISPYDITFRTNKAYYFKCKSGIHESFLMKINSIVSSGLKVECKKCYLDNNSFYSWCVQHDLETYLLWDYEKNSLSPKEVPYYSNKKYWFKCPNSIHASRQVGLCSVICANGRIHCTKCHSIGQYIIDHFGDSGLNLLWDYDKNEKSPFDIYASSKEKVYIKCINCKEHGSFCVTASNYTINNSGCPECNYERASSKLQDKVSEYISTKYKFQVLHEHNCSIIAVNPETGYLLPYDNDVIINENIHLIIEVHGEQHYKITGYGKAKARHYNCTAEEILEKQKYRDRIKKDYAIANNCYYLEVPFWEEKDDSYMRLIDDMVQRIYMEKGENNT